MHYLLDDQMAIKAEQLKRFKVVETKKHQVYLVDTDGKEVFPMHTTTVIRFLRNPEIRFTVAKYKKAFDMVSELLAEAAKAPVVAEIATSSVRQIGPAREKGISPVFRQGFSEFNEQVLFSYAIKYRFERLEKTKRLAFYVPFQVQNDFQQYFHPIHEQFIRCIDADMLALGRNWSTDDLMSLVRNIPLYTFGFLCDMILHELRNTNHFFFCRRFAVEIDDYLYERNKQLPMPALILDNFYSASHYRDAHIKKRYWFLRTCFMALNMIIIATGPEPLMFD